MGNCIRKLLQLPYYRYLQANTYFSNFISFSDDGEVNYRGSGADAAILAPVNKSNDAHVKNAMANDHEWKSNELN